MLLGNGKICPYLTHKSKRLPSRPFWRVAEFIHQFTKEVDQQCWTCGEFPDNLTDLNRETNKSMPHIKRTKS